MPTKQYLKLRKVVRRKKIKRFLEYCEYSDTIRQMPENYCIAVRRYGRWYMVPDIACNQRLAVKVFKALFDFDTLYGSAENLLKVVGG